MSEYRRHTDGRKAHEKMLSITNFREIQLESVMRYHLTMIVRMAILKNLQTINAGEGVEKMEPFCTVDGNVNGCNHYGGEYESYLKT